MKYPIIIAVLLALVVITSAGCRQSDQSKQVILATTTSFQDSGLLDVLVEEFRKQSGYELKPISVGSGEAVAMGKRGEADVMVVHSPKDEEAFMNEGFGKSRQPLMYNDYVLVGPEADPANCISATGIADAFARIAQTKSIFISRGDKSGTHKKELAVWAKAGIKPAGGDERHPALMRGAWYLEAGQGMGEVLTMADIKAAYTLSDRGTYLVHRAKTSLKIMVEGDPILINPYSVIVPSPDKFPNMNLKGAETFAEFLLAPDTQKLISEFGKDKYGQPLFYIYPKK